MRILQFELRGRRLRATSESPDIDETKAFEAVAQLDALVRLLSKQYHALAPPNSEILEKGNSDKQLTMAHSFITMFRLHRSLSHTRQDR
jgi:hypothetical protein